MVEKSLTARDKTFLLDDLGCLRSFQDWAPEFAEGMAEEVGITPPLTDAHMKIIRYLREAVAKTGRTPIVHRACKDNGLKLWEMEKLFPAGYHRGACRIAGLNYHDLYATRPDTKAEPTTVKIYRIDGCGFLIDPAEWDVAFASMRAEEMGTILTEKHWEIIRFLRAARQKTGSVPTVFETCRTCHVEVDDLEQLFPRGYQRGAVKIAGLTLTQ